MTNTTMRTMAITILLLAPGVGSAQREAPTQRWQFEDQRDGLCVWFLAEAFDLAPGVPKGITLRAASSVNDLPASLRRVLADEPRVAGWTPAVVCAERYGTARLGDEVVGRAKPAGQGHLLTFVAVATEGEQPWAVLELGTDVTALQRRGGDMALRVADRELKVSGGADGEDPTWELGLDGAKLIWVGHPTGEPRVVSTRSMSFGYAGNRNSQWSGVLQGAGGSERAQVGALRVDGKGWLAKALKASPIRAVAPTAVGGTAEITLERQRGR
jgi:hypothetical protein